MNDELQAWTFDFESVEIAHEALVAMGVANAIVGVELVDQRIHFFGPKSMAEKARAIAKKFKSHGVQGVVLSG